MKSSKKLVVLAPAALAVVIMVIGAWSSQDAYASPHNNCQWCSRVEVPDPDGGPPDTYAVCIDFDDFIGWVECWEYGTVCALWVRCNEYTDPG